MYNSIIELWLIFGNEVQTYYFLIETSPTEVCRAGPVTLWEQGKHDGKPDQR